MNRSALYTSVALVSIFVFALAACAPTPTPTAAPPTAAPPRPSGTATTAAPAASPTIAVTNPTRPIEFVISTAPGGGSDIYARAMQGIIEKNKLSVQPYLPVNKP